MASGFLPEELCRPVSSLEGCCHLHSTGGGYLDFPRVMKNFHTPALAYVLGRHYPTIDERLAVALQFSSLN